MERGGDRRLPSSNVREYVDLGPSTEKVKGKEVVRWWLEEEVSVTVKIPRGSLIYYSRTSYIPCHTNVSIDISAPCFIVFSSS
jgi:hypothetical protein